MDDLNQERATRELLGDDLYEEAQRRRDMDPDHQEGPKITFDPRGWDRWRCPECGAENWTPRSQGTLWLRCVEDHGVVEQAGVVVVRRMVSMTLVEDDS